MDFFFLTFLGRQPRKQNNSVSQNPGGQGLTLCSIFALSFRVDHLTALCLEVLTCKMGLLWWSNGYKVCPLLFLVPFISQGKPAMWEILKVIASFRDKMLLDHWLSCPQLRLVGISTWPIAGLQSQSLPPVFSTSVGSAPLLWYQCPSEQNLKPTAAVSRCPSLCTYHTHHPEHLPISSNQQPLSGKTDFRKDSAQGPPHYLQNLSWPMPFTANLNLLLQPYKQGSNHGLYTPLLNCLFFCMHDWFIYCCPGSSLLSTGYSLVAICGLLLAVASLVADHRL